MRQYYPVLTIAGSDSSGGAGIQADIKTISAIGGYAMSAITAITAQNTTAVKCFEAVGREMIREQIKTTCTDIMPLAVKTGMIPTTDALNCVADCIEELKLPNLVVDPVMVSTAGNRLIDEKAICVLKERLFPIAALVTPNMQEAIVLTGSTNVEEQAELLHQAGCRAVLLKGGDSDRTDIKTDYLSIRGVPMAILKADAINTKNTHGTGCTLSAAIATYLALGYDLEDAVMSGKLFVTRALEAGSFVTTGKGHGPINHFFSPRRLKSYNPNKQIQPFK